MDEYIEYYYYRHEDPLIEYLIRQAMWELEEVHFDPEDEWESEDNPWLNEGPEDDFWLDDLQ